MARKHPALVALPADRKELLARLIRGFDLDVDQMRITTGKDAIDIMNLMDNPPKDLYDSPSVGLSPKRLAEWEAKQAAKELAAKNNTQSKPGYIAIETVGGGVQWVKMKK